MTPVHVLTSNVQSQVEYYVQIDILGANHFLYGGLGSASTVADLRGGTTRQ